MLVTCSGCFDFFFSPFSEDGGEKTSKEGRGLGSNQNNFFKICKPEFDNSMLVIKVEYLL